MTVRTFLVVALVVAVVGLLAGCPKAPSENAETVPPIAEPGGPSAEPTEGGEEVTDETADATDDEAEDTEATEETADEAGDETTDVAELYDTKCTMCHDLARVESHDPADEAWDEVVVEMQEKKDDWISDEEAEQIIAHLTEADAGT